MSHRVTIILDDDNMKWLRRYQAKRISAEEANISFSRLINDILRDEKR